MGLSDVAVCGGSSQRLAPLLSDGAYPAQHSGNPGRGQQSYEQVERLHPGPGADGRSERQPAEQREQGPTNRHEQAGRPIDPRYAARRPVAGMSFLSPTSLADRRQCDKVIAFTDDLARRMHAEPDIGQ